MDSGQRASVRRANEMMARKREIDRLERADRQAHARANDSIDWSICLVPGCGNELVDWRDLKRAEHRDSAMDLPMCYTHAAVVWQRALGGAFKDSEMANAVSDLRFKRELRDQQDADKRILDNKGAGPGHIYYVRLNDLIKVGWTGDLEQRIKSYGASAAVLAHYPGSRQDETALHRQLRPSLARGREWYEDGPIVQRFIEDAVKRHGPPTIRPFWTKPKKPVIGKRRR